MPGKGKKRGSKSSGNGDGSGKKSKANRAPRKSDAGTAENGENGGEGGGGGSVGGKSKPRCNVDIFNEDAMQNAYYTCHNVQDLLKCRGFPWPGAQKKKKKGKRK